MTSQPEKQIIAVHILPNISKSRGNQTLKFDQLIEYNMTKNFLEKLYKKCGRETISRLFSKKSKFSISLVQWSKLLHSLYGKLMTIEIF